MISVALVRNQRPDTHDGMIDVLRELVAHCRADFVVGLAVVTIGSSKTSRSGTVSRSQTRRCDIANALARSDPRKTLSFDGSKINPLRHAPGARTT
jgi:hypothetical protein